ncbi:hypothetical protein HanHA300_Chr12g0461251 [Helianthus annuus]|nr:hypothetical protein HanHA300_Chr12g0461251 [Helianthus annuus]KAJ0506837.1 hypothetical protein HanHA89_Chr12g0486651 [Helianthus annuus]
MVRSTERYINSGYLTHSFFILTHTFKGSNSLFTSSNSGFRDGWLNLTIFYENSIAGDIFIFTGANDDNYDVSLSFNYMQRKVPTSFPNLCKDIIIISINLSNVNIYYFTYNPPNNFTTYFKWIFGKQVIWIQCFI